MKKLVSIELLTTMLFSALMILFMPVTAFADTVVTVELTDSGVSVDSSGNKLFDLGSMVPGDSAEATLHIVNNDNQKYKLYLHGEIPSSVENNSEIPNSADLLSRLKLAVTYQGSQIYPDDSVTVPPGGDIEDFAPGETNQIYLGTFSNGDTADLIATVQFLGSGDKTGEGIDDYADNAYQGLSAEVDWIITAVRTSSGGGGGGHHEHSGGDEDEEDDEEPIEVVIPEDEVPMEPVVPIEPVTVAEEEVPQMPATGFASPLPYYAFGSLAVVTGFFLSRKKKDRK